MGRIHVQCVNFTCFLIVYTGAQKTPGMVKSGANTSEFSASGSPKIFHNFRRVDMLYLTPDKL
jgi:hypothetical protein